MDSPRRRSTFHQNLIQRFENVNNFYRHGKKIVVKLMVRYVLKAMKNLISNFTNFKTEFSISDFSTCLVCSIHP